MKWLDEINNLASHLGNLSEPIRTEVDPFPSGVVWLDVFFLDRIFTLMFDPDNAFAVDDVTDAIPFDNQFTYYFDDFESAKAKLLELLSDAGLKE